MTNKIERQLERQSDMLFVAQLKRQLTGGTPIKRVSKREQLQQELSEAIEAKQVTYASYLQLKLKGMK